jgi:outer membrane protein assembly factor BamB
LLRGTWGTPVIASNGERQLLIVMHPRRVTAYDPESGQIVWICGGYSPLAYTSPITDGKLLLALGGYFGASLGLRTDGSGDVTTTHRIWHKPRDGSWLGTGVVRDGYAYVCDMNGLASCIEMASGKEMWRERLEPSGARGGTWSSGTLTGDGLVYWMNQSGDVFVFRAQPEAFEQVARNALDEATNSSVVIAGGDIILRTHTALWCIRQPTN